MKTILQKYFLAYTDAAPLAVFRILFGGIMVLPFGGGCLLLFEQGSSSHVIMKMKTNSESQSKST